MADKIRADVALVRQNLCESRERAQAAIMEGRVFLGEKRINKASEQVSSEDILTLKSPENEYVSRGALKLEKAVRAAGGICPKLVSPGTNGMPDRMVLLPGCRIGFVEVKAPGQKPRPLQQRPVLAKRMSPPRNRAASRTMTAP